MPTDNMLYFDGSIDSTSVPEAGDEVPGPDHVYSATLSSSKPVDFLMGGRKVKVVLDHSDGAVRMGRLKDGAPMIVNHDADRLAGHVVASTLTNNQIFIDFQLSGNEEGRREAMMVKEKTRSKLSVGAEPYTIVPEERDDGSVVLTVTDWEPLEASLATIPRNVDARIMQTIGRNFELHLEDKMMPEILENTGTQDAAAQVQVNDALSGVRINEAREAARTQEIDRIRSITEMGRIHDAAGDAQKFVKEGRGLSEFNAHLLKKMADDPDEPSVQRVPENSASIGMSPREMKRFSWGRIVRSLSFPDVKKHQTAAAFELECSVAAAERMGITPEGILVPNDVLTYVGQAGTAGENQEWVGTDTVGFIDNLRNASIFAQFNPTILNGLVGNVSIRKKTGSSTAYWTAEGGATTASSILSGKVPLSPRRLTTESAYDKQLIVQTDPSVDAIYRGDMVETMALEYDRAALYGSGTNSQPTGVIGQTGVTKLTDYLLANPGPSWSEIVELETAVASANAAVGNLGYAMPATGRGHCKTQAKFTNGDTPIWEPNNTVNGYGVGVSNQITDLQYWFGNWRDLIMAMWGALDMTADPFTRASFNEVRLIGMMYVDVGVRHGESFSYIERSAT